MVEGIYSQEKALIDIYNEILKESVEFNDINYKYQSEISNSGDIMLTDFMQEKYK